VKYQGLILAGGRGSRMGALCDSTPKPLLKVKGRPLIEWILRRYHDAGFQAVHIAIRYLGAKISDRYGRAFDGMGLNYIVERDALGTAGCITLLPEPAPLVVSNGDLYSSLAWADLIDFHEVGNGTLPDITMCSVPKTLQYGCLDMSPDIITERPTVRCNAGMYVLDAHVVRAVMTASAHRQDMPDVINRAAMLGSKVAVYQLQPGEWADVGTPEDLERANT
jgi:NDP-sugar pyrophosphorylase family protein